MWPLGVEAGFHSISIYPTVPEHGEIRPSSTSCLLPELCTRCSVGRGVQSEDLTKLNLKAQWKQSPDDAGGPDKDPNL